MEKPPIPDLSILDGKRHVFVRLVFDNWTLKGEPITPQAYLELAGNNFHSGTTFDGSIIMDREQAWEMARALMRGFRPRFFLYEETTL